MDIPTLYKYFKESSGVSTDTRNIAQENLFFALKGTHFDGNTYALKAIEMGAKYAVVDRQELLEESSQLLYVPDVLKALQELANHHRKTLKTNLIAITGSNGKTTTKELIKSVLEKKYTVLATAGNFNNHIGVPLTLLRLTQATEIGIIEMGANHKGEIKELCEIAAPDWGYITNFGKAHLEGFGSIEGVIEGKSELYDFLKRTHGRIVINGDDPVQKKLCADTDTISFGKALSTHHIFKEIRSEDKQIVLKNNITLYSSGLYGKYNIPNIAVAITMGKIFNIPDALIQEGIASYQPENNRSQIVTKGRLSIVLDAYNANPTSMKAALEAFFESEADNKKVVLGDMLELGSYAAMEHQEILDRCIKSKLNAIILVGECFYQTTTSDTRVIKFKTTLELTKYLEKQGLHCDKLLIKGSRGMALEKVVPLL